MSLQVGQIIKGKVNNIKKFGAFVELPDGNVGLLHISEVSDEYVKDVGDYLKRGQEIYVKVIEMKDSNQIRLSVRGAKEENESLKNKPVVRSKPKFKERELTFEEKLANYMQDSRETQFQLAKNLENKRGGRKKKKNSNDR